MNRIHQKVKRHRKSISPIPKIGLISKLGTSAPLAIRAHEIALSRQSYAEPLVRGEHLPVITANIFATAEHLMTARVNEGVPSRFAEGYGRKGCRQRKASQPF